MSTEEKLARLYAIRRELKLKSSPGFLYKVMDGMLNYLIQATAENQTVCIPKNLQELENTAKQYMNYNKFSNREEITV